MPNIILSHSGKQHAYQVAKTMHDLEVLNTFYTSSYIRSDKLQNYLLQKGNTFWTRRFVKGLPGKKVNANWRFEIPEIIWRKFTGKSPKTQDAVYQRDINFDRYVAKKLFNHQPSRTSHPIFWGFQGSCHASLKSANTCDMVSICELATAHAPYAKKILGEEARLQPVWADSIDNLEFPPAYYQRLVEEPQIAQKVVAASKFTVASLVDSGIAENKIIYLPLGFDATGIPFNTAVEPTENRPLRLLYAGTVTQRKGIGYLLEAMNAFNKTEVELHIIGGIQGSGEAFAKYRDKICYHPPVSQQEMFKQYQTYDALVLPTIFEGFGLVIVEAMAAGLPVITTSHSMGPDVIENDKNGYLIPIRDVQAIQQSIESLRNKTTNELMAMRHAARHAALTYTWENYHIRLKTFLQTLNH